MNPLETIISAQSIAVVGASRDPQKVGYQVLANLSQNKKLKLYPVNPKARSILKLPVYESLVDIKDPVEVVVIAVPVPFVSQVIDDCIEKKVKAVLLITAGFSELSTSGKKLQQQIRQKLAKANIALLGPNTLGLIAPHVKLNASFANKDVLPGSLALISQSGAILTALFAHLHSENMGCSIAISLGNKAGISENEALEYAAKDKQTKVIALYLESFADLPKFFQLCSTIVKNKPIILLKGGRSKRGQSASLSHTAALATNYQLLHSAQAQAGFVLADTVQEFIQTATFLQTQRTIPSNVMVVTNAGGPAVNTIDLLEKASVPLARWSSTSRENLSNHLPRTQINNPLDILGDARTEQFQLALQQAQTDQNIDSVLFLITQQSVTDIPQIVKMFINKKGRKPIFVALMGGREFDKYRIRLRQAGITCTNFPDQAVNILRILTDVANARLQTKPFLPDIFSRNTQKLSEQSELSLDIETAFSLLQKYEINVPKFKVVTREKDYKQALVPSFAKTANLSLKHKKLLGALYGKVHSFAQAKAAYQQLAKFGNAVLYQELVEIEHEFLIGVQKDEQMGWYMAFGLGGSNTNVLGDRAYVFLPARKKELRQAFSQTKAWQLLEKSQQNWTEQILQVAENLQRLVINHPKITELEINPLVANQSGIWAADVKLGL